MTIPRLDKLDRNYLINGGMDFFQRSVAVQTISGAFSYLTSDRWIPRMTGTTYTVAQSERIEDAPSNTSLRYCHQHNMDRSANATSSSFMHQRIESIFARDLVGKPLSFSFYNKFSLLNDTTLTVRVYTADVADDFSAKTLVHTEVVSTTGKETLNTWHNYKLDNLLTAPGGSERGIEIEVEWGYSAADDAGLESLKSTGYKLNIGTKAQDFSYAGRDLEEELRLCWRYYINYAEGIFDAVNTQYIAYGTYSAFTGSLLFRNKMRVTPVVVSSAMSDFVLLGQNASMTQVPSSITDYYANNKNQQGVTVTCPGNFPAVSNCSLRVANNKTNVVLGHDAEL